MSQTKMRAGRLVAAYVANALGRRLVLVDPGNKDDDMFFGSQHRAHRTDTLVAATTQAECKELIATLYQLCEELPP